MLSFASTSLFPFPSRTKTVAGRHRKSNAAGKRSHIRRLLGEQLEARRVLASYTVDTANDIVAEDGMLSLREAIQAANMNAVINADTVAGGAGPGTIDTITFAAGLSTLTLGSELSITDSLRISLGDASEITIRGNNAARIFSIDANPDATIFNTVSIEGLMLKDGVAAVGGAIYVATGQSLSLDSVTLSGNTATGDAATQGGGAIYNDGGTLSLVDSTLSGNAASGTSGSGGAIFNATGGTLQIATSMITGNTANRAGGGIETTAGSNASLTNVNVNGNSLVNATASPGNGGGVHVGGNAVVAIVGGTVNDNQAVEGGGVWTSASGSLTIDGTMIDGNTAAAGGGIYNDVAATATNEVFGLTFTELNGSGVTGTGSVTVTSPTATTRTVRVVIDAEGLEDVSAFGGIHAAHIHGQFAGNAARPILEQGDGPFFDGAGGLANGFAPIDSVLPSIADDGVTIEDGFLDFLEGQPKYGPVLLNLTSTQLRDASAFSSNPPAGVPPLAHFLALADNGAIDPSALFPSGTEFNLDTTYTFDLTNPDEARQFNNLAPLDFREVVLHGQTIDKSISDAIDAAAMGTAPGGIDLGNGTAFRVTAPVAAAEIVPMGSSVPTTNAAINNATIRNATIRNNAATGNAAVEGGGGIHNENGSLTITNSTITGNVATGAAGSGGGIINVGGTVSVTNSEISGNTANRAGGGIETTSGSTITLNGVTLDTNSAGVDIGAGATPAPGNGGGLHVSGDGTVNVTGGTVSGNRAALEGGGLWNSSGSMTIDGTTISGNTASGDTADDGGGGIFNNGGTLIINGGAVSMNVADGSSGSGGGILNLGGSTTVTDTEISGNTANRAGGGIETTSGSTVTLNGVTLDNNSAGVDIGAGATPAPGNGGGLHVSGDGAVNVTGGTISGNRAALEGGGLWNDSGTMTIDGTTISGNTASGDAADDGGGGIFNNGGTLIINGGAVSMNVADGSSGSGGGILNLGGSTTVTNSEISGNTANRAGGGIETTSGSTVTLDGVTLDTNSAGVDIGVGATPAPGNGGGLHVSGNGTVTVTGGTVSGNVAAQEGGGLWNDSGLMTISGTSLLGNTANAGNNTNNDQGGGGIFNNGGTLAISGATIRGNISVVNAGNGGGVMTVGGTVTINNTALSENVAARAGGAIENNAGEVTLTNVILGGELNAGNTAGINGGAVHLSGQAMLSVLESTVASNTAANEGGGLWNSAAGTIHVVRSTLSGNTAQDGGGIFNDGTTGDITIANSTIAANSATNLGGGIASEGGKLTLTSVTLAGNTAAAGGGIATQGADFTATNTLVANNNAATGADALGTINSGGNNLFGDSSGVTLLGTSSSDIIDVDAGLGMLDDNGGPTQTIALLDASPALNAGVAAGLSIDQRGVARPQGLAIDIGAFESSLGGAVGKALLSIAATDAIKKEGDSGLTPFTFTVTRSGNTDVEATVDYAVTGTGLHQATADDFKNGVFPSGTIEFAQGELSQTLTIYVRGDTAVEIYDRFRVTLDNPSATAETIDATANGTILDDDLVIPSLNIIIPHQVEGGQTIPGDGSTNAILFQSLTDTVVSVTPVGTAVINERILIFDTHIQLISTMHGTIATADLEAGGVYAIVFEPQSFDRIFAIRTSTGSGTLSQAAPTNILQPTDTNGSGETTALDAVIVINAIDRNHGTQGEQVIPRFLDVNRDNKVSALDALQIINHLNRIGSGLVQTDAHGESIPMLITSDSTLQTQSASQRDDAVDALFRNSSSESIGNSFVDPSSPTIDPPSIHSTANLDAVDEAMEEDEFGSNSVLQDPIELLV